MHLLILMRYIDCEICLLGAQRRICPTLSMGHGNRECLLLPGL
jgi:hypothetical protein